MIMGFVLNKLRTLRKVNKLRLIQFGTHEIYERKTHYFISADFNWVDGFRMICIKQMNGNR
ncbi:MAG: hypothetical protein A2W85_05125 [Bacteroidetes bacterium GWF2_41_31]|nr:MAG: hypothetical protein A2W85_05125 [Bacteroidetes bacterium GWF2_41_31]OFZ07626.1 MAG: hypothetical protein A2338_08070 [Bacteroidetes bacterium RIFOXYB12_FULL_41_6]